jgi:hypothetical protein
MTATRLALDFEDVKTGFQTGKAAALSEWAFRKEQAEFEVLVNRLRVKKWAKEHPERRRAIGLRYYHESPGAKQRQLARARRRRREQQRASAPVIVCAECRVEFCCAKLQRGGKPRKYCTVACMQRERYQRITPGARRVKRTGGQP